MMIYATPVFAGNEIILKDEQPSLTTAPASQIPTKDNIPSTDTPNIWQEPLSGMEFVWVDGGCYTMGCGPWDPDCRSREQPEHEVCLNGFWIGRYEVTQGEWKKLLGTNPAMNRISDRHPVDRVSWNDSLDIIERLNARKYGLRFRLPTEAEWEFVARGRGRPEPFSGGKTVDDVAWYLSNSNDVPHAVGTKAANSLYVYDMSGNVREWVEDRYDPDYYQMSPTHNPQGPPSGTMRVIRGGSWNSNSHTVRTTSRAWNTPAVRVVGYGMRLVAVPFQ